MKAKILKTVSIIQAFVLIMGMCMFTVPLKADAASLGITPSAQYQSSVYYQRACTAYESYTDPRTRFVQVALSQAGYKGGTYSGNWAGNGTGGSYTEYGRFMGADGADWCASFVSWCAAAAGIPTSVIPRSSGAGYWRNPGTGTYTPIWSNNYTTYNAYKPQVGDFALYMPYCETCYKHYNAQSPSAHVVIVASVSDTQNANGSWTFTTIERGNGNTVESHTLTTKDTRGSTGTCTCGKQTPANQYSYVVQGFWRPDWSLLGTTIITAGDVYGTLKWTIDTNGVLNITGTGDMPSDYAPWKTNSDLSSQVKTVVIGEGITTVSDRCFLAMNGIKSVTLPSTMKRIGSLAFAACSNLNTVNLPSGLEEISDKAFSGTSSISAMQIPSNVRVIGDYAFSGCNGITNVTLSNTLTYVGNGAFEDCTNLTNVIVANGVTKIPEYIFFKCTAISSVTIPESVTSIERLAFGGCSNLTDVYLSVSQSEWANTATVGDSAFLDTVTFHFKESYLDFKVIENESNTVTLSWNQDEYSYAYDVIIYDEIGFLLESHRVDAADAVDGVVTTTFNLRGGNYKAEIVCLNTAGIIITDEVSFTVEMTDADNYSIDALYGSVSNGRFYAEVEVVNVTEREVADTVVIAVYKNEEMIDFVYMKADLPQGQTVTFGGMLEGVEGAKLKAFVWDSIKGMKSLSNVVEK